MTVVLYLCCFYLSVLSSVLAASWYRLCKINTACLIANCVIICSVASFHLLFHKNINDILPVVCNFTCFLALVHSVLVRKY